MNQTLYFPYGRRELDYLSERDKRLGALIARTGLIQREVNPDLFSALANTIVGQQLSGNAAETVWKRLLAALDGACTPENLAAYSREELRSCGLSYRKADYLLSAADAVRRGELNLEKLHTLSDQEVCDCLTRLHGVGVWTAEMLMIFSLQRPDILSWNDLGIRRGITLLYDLEELDRDFFERCRARYSPYASVASFYFWTVRP